MKFVDFVAADSQIDFLIYESAAKMVTIFTTVYLTNDTASTSITITYECSGLQSRNI